MLALHVARVTHLTVRVITGRSMQARTLRSVVVTSFLLTASLCAWADEKSEADAKRVNAIADRWLEQIESRFPVTYLGGGLPMKRHDALEQNAPQDLASWREFLAGIEKELAQIPEERLIGRPEWVTWHYMRQGLAQSEAAKLCRNELWQVSAYGWVAHLMHLANLQPVGTDDLRHQALLRWRSVPGWLDQEIANLREGLRLGYTATEGAARGLLTQLDSLLAEEPGKSAFMSPATRDDSPAFRADWTAVIAEQVWPALRRYRDFLRDEYMPRARKVLSVGGNTNGLKCYRASIYANTTVDDEPRKLFAAAKARERAERELAVTLGKKVYGAKARDWQTLAPLVIADSRYRFTSSSEIATYARETVARAAAAIDRMVRNPPSAVIKIEPFPEFMQRSGPGGEYVPGADDGSRPPLFYFRDDPERQFRGPFEDLIFHETLPGHHLQAAVLAQNQRAALHPITRVLWFSGPGEGWATYAESLARELGLYTSDYEVICALMSSTTSVMVADLGIQVMGWSKERTIAYFVEAQPFSGAERAERMVGTLTGVPGLGVAYPLGAMQFEQMRATAQEKLGERFDLREFHRIMLEDGRLPFSALRAKLARWLKAR
jgi:uncharacterized protein (DUF885 family)